MANSSISQTRPDPEGTFRDKVGTISDDGRRRWIFPKKPSGRLYRGRTWVSWGLLGLLFAGPFLRVNGLPVLMANIPERKFILFGQIFWPQDFWLLALGLLSLVVFVVLFTVVFGRVFCGWACPQTIFMEMVFRKIEYWIEGDGKAQEKLAQAPWDASKWFKKLSKWFLFFVVSFLISNTFLAYIIGNEALWDIVTDPVSEHLTGFMAIMLFTGVFYFVFAYMREQVCIVVCPYGRLQGVMLDRDSVVVAYDYLRGEPRGPVRRNQERTTGDCVDCHQCVRVCPTGIDIRNGTQLECINCTACIDACDAVMDKLGRETGLIRYDSENAIAERRPWRLGNRAKAYVAVLMLLVGALTAGLIVRKPVDATLLREAGLTWQVRPDGKVSNLYQVKILNKTNDALPVSLVLDGLPGELQFVGNAPGLVPAGGMLEQKFFVIVSPDTWSQGRSHPIEILLKSGDETMQTMKSTFMTPSQ